MTDQTNNPREDKGYLQATDGKFTIRGLAKQQGIPYSSLIEIAGFTVEKATPEQSVIGVIPHTYRLGYINKTKDGEERVIISYSSKPDDRLCQALNLRDFLRANQIPYKEEYPSREIIFNFREERDRIDGLIMRLQE